MVYAPVSRPILEGIPFVLPGIVSLNTDLVGGSCKVCCGLGRELFQDNTIGVCKVWAGNKEPDLITVSVGTCEFDLITKVVGTVTGCGKIVANEMALNVVVLPPAGVVNTSFAPGMNAFTGFVFRVAAAL